MAEPGTPKSTRAEPSPLARDAGKLVPKTEPRPGPVLPSGARTIPARSPKAPLAPRASQAEAAEPSVVPSTSSSTEPAVAKIEAPVIQGAASARQAVRPPRPSMVGGRGDVEIVAAGSIEVERALAHLLTQQPETPAPLLTQPAGLPPFPTMPAGPPPFPTMPAGPPPLPAQALRSKPRESLAPTAPPPPNVSSAFDGAYADFGAPPLRSNDTIRQLPSTATVETNADPGGSIFRAPEPPAHPDVPNDLDTENERIRESSARSLPTAFLGSPSPIQPIVPSTSNVTAPLGTLHLKSGAAPRSPGRPPSPFAIVGGASLRMHADNPASVRSSTADSERASRPWSSPATALRDDQPVSSEEPVSFQVYTAEDIGAGRGPMRSVVLAQPANRETSLGLRIGVALLGGLIVLLTAAAVIAVSTDDPKPPAPSATASPSTRLSPSVTSTFAPLPARSTSFGSTSAPSPSDK